jgi:hypothetical protein
VINLHALRKRARSGPSVTLEAADAVEIAAELETARRLAGLPADGTTPSLGAQQEMVSQLLMNLAAGVAGKPEADLVAGVVVQELAGLARLHVRQEKR